MRILVAAATAAEIKPFIQACQSEQIFTDLSIVITGIGLTATTYSLTKQFSLFKPDLAIQAGIGGCFDKSLPLGNVYAIKQDLIADQGVMEHKEWKSMHDLKFIKPNDPPYQKKWLLNNTGGLSYTKLKQVSAISVNSITTAPALIKQYETKFNPVIESMEGAAFHYVCLREQIPFVQIRAISNYIGERNKRNWNFAGSISNLNLALTGMLLNI